MTMSRTIGMHRSCLFAQPFQLWWHFSCISHMCLSTQYCAGCDSCELQLSWWLALNAHIIITSITTFLSALSYLASGLLRNANKNSDKNTINFNWHGARFPLVLSETSRGLRRLSSRSTDLANSSILFMHSLLLSWKDMLPDWIISFGWVVKFQITARFWLSITMKAYLYHRTHNYIINYYEGIPISQNT